MSPGELPALGRLPHGPHFATTNWQDIAIAKAGGSTEASLALENLCRAYWFPLYAYARHRGHDLHEAQDLIQAFFAHLLQHQFLESVQRSKGRFRSFLLVSLNNFLVKEWIRSNRLKRGGGRIIVSFDQQAAETRLRLEPVDELTPEKLFERRWAAQLLERALERLEAEHRQAGKTDLFQALKELLTDKKSGPAYGQLAARLGMTEAAVKMVVHRLRHRYGQLLRAEIAQTVTRPEEVDQEIRELFAALA